jgi:hypothetical protein
MSDPTERKKVEPHPVSAHRTPEEIAKDEAGPIGDASNPEHKKPPAEQGPVLKLDKGTVERPGPARRDKSK